MKAKYSKFVDMNKSEKVLFLLTMSIHMFVKNLAKTMGNRDFYFKLLIKYSLFIWLF